MNELYSSGKLDTELSESASRMRKAFFHEISGSSMTIEDAKTEFRKRVEIIT